MPYEERVFCCFNKNKSKDHHEHEIGKRVPSFEEIIQHCPCRYDEQGHAPPCMSASNGTLEEIQLVFRNSDLHRNLAIPDRTVCLENGTAILVPDRLADVPDDIL